MAEKKPRKRKSLKVDLENKVEETIIETTKVEEVQKEKKPELPKLDPKKMYEFISNGKYPTLTKGKVWQVTGEIALIFIQRGYGELKK